jgi:uncharacterized protein with von Willebrand factor type A (vWA) domain
MLSFFPQVLSTGECLEDLEPPPMEFIFVLDRSGSMSGQRIEMAKEAALFFLKSLPANARFNVVSFGSDFRCMFD